VPWGTRNEERFGAVGDDMQAMVRGACGDLDSDRGEGDWAFSAPSQVTYYMQHIVLAGVMADAAMVDGVIALRRTSTGGCLRGLGVAEICRAFVARSETWLSLTLAFALFV
jgi:hypothetical protein